MKPTDFINENAEDLNIGDPVIITGNVQFKGKTGDIVDFGKDKRFVIVNLYNYGKHSFHSSDVSYNDYAESGDEQERMSQYESKIVEAKSLQSKFEKHLARHGYDVGEKSKYWEKKIKDIDAQIAAWDAEMERRGINNPYKKVDEDEYDDGNEEGFFVAIGSEENGGFVGMVYKEGGKWREQEVAGNPPYNWGASYMGYLSPGDVMQWIRQDYGRHSRVKGPFDTEEAAFDYASRMYGLGESVTETTGVTDYNPKSRGGTRKELLAKYHKTKDPKDAAAARKAGATQKELQTVEEGWAKNIKRGLQGWYADATDINGEKMTPRDVVRRNKNYDDETLQRIHKAVNGPGPGFPFSNSKTKHSPADLQKRVLDREMKKRGLGEQGVAEETKTPAKKKQKRDIQTWVNDLNASDKASAEVMQQNMDAATRFLKEKRAQAAKEIHDNLFQGTLNAVDQKNFIRSVLKAHGLTPADAPQVIELVRKLGYAGNKFEDQGVAEGSPQSMGTALRNTLSKVEPGSKLDKKIRHHNDMVRRFGPEAGTMTSAPDGYHIDKKGFVRLGEGVAEGLGSYDNDKGVRHTRGSLVAKLEALPKGNDDFEWNRKQAIYHLQQGNMIRAKYYMALMKRGEQGVAEGSYRGTNLDKLIQRYEDMQEIIYHTPPGKRSNLLQTNRDKLRSKIVALPGGKEALDKWADDYTNTFNEGVAEGEYDDPRWEPRGPDMSRKVDWDIEAERNAPEEPEAAKTVTVTDNDGNVVLTFPSTGGFYGDLRHATGKGIDTESGEYHMSWKRDANEDVCMTEDTGATSEQVASEIVRRIINRHKDAITAFGPEAIMAAAREVGEFFAGAEELGTSDISIATKYTLDKLDQMSRGALGESASAGGTSAGAIATTPGGGTGKNVGSLFGGTYKQKRTKKSPGTK